MKRSVWIRCSAVILVAFFSVLVSSNVGAQQKTITLNYSNLLPAPHKISLACEDWCKEIEKGRMAL